MMTCSLADRYQRFGVNFHILESDGRGNKFHLNVGNNLLDLHSHIPKVVKFIVTTVRTSNLTCIISV
jgi:hypothetical protein